MSTHRSIELDGSVRSLFPLLVEAVRHVGNTRVRNMGTVDGSIVHNDPVAEIPLVLGLLNAEYELADGRTRRTATSRDFPTGPFETEDVFAAAEEAIEIDYDPIPRVSTTSSVPSIQTHRRYTKAATYSPSGRSTAATSRKHSSRRMLSLKASTTASSSTMHISSPRRAWPTSTTKALSR